MRIFNLPNTDLSESISIKTSALNNLPGENSNNTTMNGIGVLCGCSICQDQEARMNSETTQNNSFSDPVALTVPSSAPYYVKGVDSGYVWSNNGNGVTINYKFWTSLPSYYSSGSSEANNFQPFTTAQKAAAEKVLDMLESIANVTFNEVSSDSAADIGFAQANLGSGTGAWAYYPGSSGKSGDVWTNNYYSATKTVTEGSYGFMLLLHETGHAMGLKHSFSSPNALTGAEDSSRYTVMSYTWPMYAESYMLYDIAALQAKYSANTSYNSGNTNYELDYGAVYTIWDGGGTDTLDGSSISSAMTINLNDGEFSSVGKTNNIAIAFNATIENAKGGNGSDTIYGNNVSNHIWGNGGNDKLYGSAGNDILDGGSGTDTVIYDYSISQFLISLVNSVTVTLSHALLGLDTLINVEKFKFGSITYDFDDLDDYASDGGGDDGTSDDDDTGNDDDTGDDNGDNGTGSTINGDDGSDTLIGTSGDDVIYGYGGYDKLYGGTGNDELHGGDYIDKLYGEDGNDILHGDKGYDYLYGGVGDDTLHGGDYYDRLYGDSGHDILNGDEGNDYLYGGIGDDTLDGGTGNDRLYGQDGNDTIKGSAGNDYIYGDGGTDTVVYEYNIQDFLISIIGSTYIKLTHAILGTDTLKDIENFTFEGLTYSLSDLQDYLNSDSGNDDSNDDTGEDDTGNNDGDDTLHGTEGYDTLSGGGGNDTLYGYGSYDKLYGGQGNDELHGGGYFDRLYGEDGNDTLYGDDGNDYLYGGVGDDILHGGEGADRLYGDEGNDTINGDNGNDTLYGGSGSDVMNGSDGDDRLYGQDGNDILRGGSGNDYLYGDNGDDVLIAGLGQDMLYGKGGSDIFAFDTLDDNADYIRDFTLEGTESDKLNITDILSGFDGSNDISDFVQLEIIGTSRMDLIINQDGAGNDWVKAATITGSNFSDTTLNDLIANGQLITSETPL